MTRRQTSENTGSRPGRCALAAVAVLTAAGALVPAHSADRVAWAASTEARTASARAAAPGLRNPGAVAVAPDGTIYIADTTNSRVVAVAPDGTATVVPTSTLNKPLGVAVDSSGNLFIADTNNNRILEEPAGGGTESVVASGVEPEGIAVDSQDNVLFTAWPAGILMTVPASGGTPSAVTLTGVDDPASAVGKLYGVAVDSQGNIFGSDVDGVSPAGPSVWEIAPDGSTNAVVTGLKSPHGVATDGQYVYVADSRHNQVLKESLSDQTQTTVGTGLNDPWGVALDAAGDVYIADTGNNRVVEVTPAGVQTTITLQFPTVGSGTPPASPPEVGSGSPTNVVDAVHAQIGPGETQALSVVAAPGSHVQAQVVTGSGYPRTAVLYLADSHGRFQGHSLSGTREIVPAREAGRRIAYLYRFKVAPYQGRGCALLTFTVPTHASLGAASMPVEVIGPDGRVTHPAGSSGALFTVAIKPHVAPGSLRPTSPAALSVIARQACLGQI